MSLQTFQDQLKFERYICSSYNNSLNNYNFETLITINSLQELKKNKGNLFKVPSFID